MSEKHIILASRSPRRKKLLEDAGFEITVRPADIQENSSDGSSPVQMVIFLARIKAEAVADAITDDEIIIGADTIVYLNGEIFGKPGDAKEAAQMLNKLSGKIHQVITGVHMLSKDRSRSFSESTDVHFKTLTDEQIEHYISVYEPFDKAGAYAIQEWIGEVGIEKIEGSYDNVVGLPVSRIVDELETF